MRSTAAPSGPTKNPVAYDLPRRLARDSRRELRPDPRGGLACGSTGPELTEVDREDRPVAPGRCQIRGEAAEER
ncbi:hypothetical protein NDU88_002675 [Pleurodeles waltl]|uniref:Uncharacterized protein n=1 Tax=Pleurodeles waltl TaxID=8319 RepID=A0AAV7TMG0_PLEWA|nr:hypothetical protein NDU88_002675 [Pleurodeles waltl]